MSGYVVRGARTFSGYQAVFCDKLAQAPWRRLSAGAAGCLFELRLWADRSVVLTRNTRNHGKVFDDEAGFFWSVARALEVLGQRFDEAEMTVSGWLVELRRGAFVTVDEADEVIVADFVADDLRKAGNVQRVDFAQDGRASGFSGSGVGELAGDDVEGFGGHSGASFAPAHEVDVCARVGGRSPAPASSPPARLGCRVGAPALVRGGKGGVYSETTDLGKQQTPNPNSDVRFKQPNQTTTASASQANANGREDLGAGGDDAGAGEFYAQIWSGDLFRACQWACRDYSPGFKNWFDKFAREHSRDAGDADLRRIAESVALDFRDRPHTITAVDPRSRRKIGGPVFRQRVMEFQQAQAKKRMGFT